MTSTPEPDPDDNVIGEPSAFIVEDVAEKRQRRKGSARYDDEAADHLRLLLRTCEHPMNIVPRHARDSLGW